ncbi:hypothetical protein C2G38_2066038, partial [Gigaspora rosea]
MKTMKIFLWLTIICYIACGMLVHALPIHEDQSFTLRSVVLSLISYLAIVMGVSTMIVILLR